jgi:hypothetical protein
MQKQWYQKTCSTKQQLDAAVDRFDQVYHQNVAAAAAAGVQLDALRIVPDHTKPGQFRVQQFKHMMDGVPKWTKVFTGTHSDCDHYVATCHICRNS